MATIHTVLGEIDPSQAGITLTHEHIMYANPGCEYDHQTIYDVEEVATDVAAQLDRAADRNGIATMVDLTPIEVGRNPLLLKAVAEKTKVNIIGTTGFFPERIGIPYHFRKQEVGYLADFFLRDLTEGMAAANHRTDVKGRHHQDRHRLQRRQRGPDPAAAQRPAGYPAGDAHRARSRPGPGPHRVPDQYAHRAVGLRRHQPRHRAARPAGERGREPGQGPHRARVREPQPRAAHRDLRAGREPADRPHRHPVAARLGRGIRRAAGQVRRRTRRPRLPLPARLLL